MRSREKTRNAKIETISNDQKAQIPKQIVSDFELRISDFDQGLLGYLAR